MPIGHFANWKMLDPRKLRPVSIEPRRAETAVMTPMTEKTPIVMPDIVRKDRSLFTPSDPKAMRRISFIPEGDDGIELRGARGGKVPGEDAGRDGDEHRDHDEAGRELERERRECCLHAKAGEEGEGQAHHP